MKKLLWIGSYVSGDALDEARARGYRNPASVQSQMNLLEGLEIEYGQKFDTIGALVLLPYPITKYKSFKEIRFSHNEGASDVLVGFTNRKYVSTLSAKKALVKEVKLWAEQHKEDEVEVFVYEMRSGCLRAASILKKIIPSAKIFLIVPDLPAFMDLRMSKIKKILKQIDWRLIKKDLPCVDGYILYAETMAEYLGIPKNKYIVMEGSINIKDIINESVAAEDKGDIFAVMYSGHLEERFKIQNLVDAFQYLERNFELWTTGTGNAVEYIKKIAKEDSRIKYYGFLPKREDLLNLQAKADIFVNMRDPEEKASHYCFPSKLFEYMLTGKIVLSCRLKGIPEDYFEYLVEMKDVSPYEIANSIKEVASMEKQERKKIGEKSRDYVIQNKNNIKQAQKIINFVQT